MRHLGGISGTGILKCGSKTLSRAHYDLDGFLRKPGDVIGSGEIRMSADTLQQIFGREDLQLLTDDGRLMNLRFSEKSLPMASDAAHVEVTGNLPSQAEWRH